ncbi:hypothetical protein FZEAL_6951 [Fusarium zealandicum]|uniref:Ankyrin n=1 Tax=Fusarium zealandicum TaxID=1053134 RepID=A0A8H4XIC0_9HYPO|nr:hypothetical protein FZEAL_6951 [Fusarium zealandicum]
MMSRSHLPDDILFEIAQHLPAKSLAAWSQTSHYYYDNVTPLTLQKLGPCKYQAVAKWEPQLYQQNVKLSETPPGLWEQAMRSLPQETSILSRGSVLMWAASRGHVRTVRNILAVEERGPWIDMPILSSGCGTTFGSFGMTPMHIAAKNGHAAIIELLVEYGANVDATVVGRLRPIHFARSEGVIETLIEHGSSIHRQETSSLSPLMQVLMNKPHLSAVRCLIRFGCDPNDTTWAGRTAGECAVQTGNIEALQLLLDAGLDVSTAATTEGSIVYKTICYNEDQPDLALQLVKLLLDHGAPAQGGLIRTTKFWKTHILRSNLYTATMMPASGPLIELLIQYGANPGTASWEWKRGERECSLHWMCFFHLFQEPIKPLFRLFFEASEARGGHDDQYYLPTAELLLKNGATIGSHREASTWLKYLLSCFISNRTSLEAVITLLLDKMAGMPASRGRHFIKRQPIHFVLSSEYHFFTTRHPDDASHGFRILQRLTDSGADTTEPDSEGNSPLSLLCQLPFGAYETQKRGKTNAGEILLTHGADINTLWDENDYILRKIVTNPTKWANEGNVFSWYFDSVSPEDCNLETRDANGMTPLGRLSAILFGTLPPNWWPLNKRQFYAWRRVDFTSFLLQKGADVHATQGTSEDKPLCAGGTPLHFACYDWDPAMLRLLLEHGASKDVNTVTDTGLTPVMILKAALSDGVVEETEFKEMEQLLLDAQADQDLKGAERDQKNELNEAVA